MKNLIFTLFLSSPFLLFAQHNADCEPLAVNLLGILSQENGQQFVLEASNGISSNLYYYPGFAILNTAGDTIAKEKVHFYGIGFNFQKHYLDFREDIRFPFKGELVLTGSFYQNQFCSIPIEIDDMDILSKEELEEPIIKIGFSLSKRNLLIDLSDFSINVENLDFYISISNDFGEEVYNANNLELSITSIPIETIGEAGSYYLSVWNNHHKKLLPVTILEIE